MKIFDFQFFKNNPNLVLPLAPSFPLFVRPVASVSSSNIACPSRNWPVVASIRRLSRVLFEGALSAFCFDSENYIFFSNYFFIFLLIFYYILYIFIILFWNLSEFFIFKFFWNFRKIFVEFFFGNFRNCWIHYFIFCKKQYHCFGDFFF